MRPRTASLFALTLTLVACVPAGPTRSGSTGRDPAATPRGDVASDPGVRAAPVPAVAPPAGRARSPEAAPTGWVADLAHLANAHRRGVGCDTLDWNRDLGDVATAHSEAMSAGGFFDHVDRQGRDPFARLRAAGITQWRVAAENLALTPREPPEVLRMWLNSPGHRANIENCAFREQGIGLVDAYWTHLFTG
jgi:uncharacterized protein YkwD